MVSRPGQGHRRSAVYLRQPGEGQLGEGMDRLAVDTVRGVVEAGARSSRLVAPAVLRTKSTAGATNPLWRTKGLAREQQAHSACCTGRSTAGATNPLGRGRLRRQVPLRGADTRGEVTYDRVAGDGDSAEGRGISRFVPPPLKPWRASARPLTRSSASDTASSAPGCPRGWRGGRRGRRTARWRGAGSWARPWRPPRARRGGT